MPTGRSSLEYRSSPVWGIALTPAILLIWVGFVVPVLWSFAARSTHILGDDPVHGHQRGAQDVVALLEADAY
jgi:hypothetical protein